MRRYTSIRPGGADAQPGPHAGCITQLSPGMRPPGRAQARPVTGLASWCGSAVPIATRRARRVSRFVPRRGARRRYATPRVHDADHAGGLGGHRALEASPSGRTRGRTLDGRSRSLAHRSAGGRRGRLLMTGLALDPRFIVPLLPPGLEEPYRCLVLVNLSEYRRTGHGRPMCRSLWPHEIYWTHEARNFPAQGDTDATLTTRLSRAAARRPHQGGDRGRVRAAGARARV